MRLLDMPQAFLGFALWRAWVSLTYANPSVPMPVSGTAGQFAYDVVLAGSALSSSPCSPAASRLWPDDAGSMGSSLSCLDSP